MNKSLILIQTTVPFYRVKVYEYLRAQLGDQFKVFCGKKYFDPTITTTKDFSPDNWIKNHYFFNRKFLWQTGHWKAVLQDNTLILSLNPRVLSHWVILILRRLKGKKTVLWGHAWPRSGKDSRSDTVRNWMRILASQVIVYTSQQKDQLQHKMPNKAISAAPNALFLKKEMEYDSSITGKNIIYVGRLVADKKPILLYEAFKKAINKIPEDSNLLIVGDGPELVTIEKMICRDGLEDRVKVLGQISDVKALKKLYNTCAISVSPGYVGLSITQSLGLGVPMMIARNENHSPEIEAVREGYNAIFFESDNIQSLAYSLIEFFNGSIRFDWDKNEIIEDCRNRYSIETMTETFINLMK